jgi:hypothetical protein
MYNEKHEQMKAEAVEKIRIHLNDGEFDGYYCDLHNELFNTDYYIVGREWAENALEEYGVFKAINLVQTYEKEQFGEVYTDLSDPEKVINMVWYIIGDDVIGEMFKIPEFEENWNNKADQKTNENIAYAMWEMGM